VCQVALDIIAREEVAKMKEETKPMCKELHESLPSAE
jgi:hypothetical protein